MVRKIMDKQWEKGKKNALLFYGNKMPYKAKQFNFIFPLHAYFGEMIGMKESVTIADIGAGMFSTTGSTWLTSDVQLYPSDVLADEYNGILVSHKVIPVIPVERQDMTQLTYKDNFFDIVNCVNALDHCSDPLKALQEMYRVCKVDGWIYLRHYCNNAEYEKYSGFHTWNISDTDNGDCLIWNQSCQFLTSDYFKNVKVVKGNNPEERGMVTITVRKK